MSEKREVALTQLPCLEEVSLNFPLSREGKKKPLLGRVCHFCKKCKYKTTWQANKLSYIITKPS